MKLLLLAAAVAITSLSSSNAQELTPECMDEILAAGIQESSRCMNQSTSPDTELWDTFQAMLVSGDLEIRLATEEEELKGKAPVAWAQTQFTNSTTQETGFYGRSPGAGWEAQAKRRIVVNLNGIRSVPANERIAEVLATSPGSAISTEPTKAGLKEITAALVFHEALHAVDDQGHHNLPDGSTAHIPDDDLEPYCTHLRISIMTMNCLKQRACLYRDIENEQCETPCPSLIDDTEPSPESPADVRKDICAFIKDRDRKLMKGWEFYDPATGNFNPSRGWSELWKRCSDLAASGDTVDPQNTSSVNYDDFPDLPINSTPPSTNVPGMLDCCD